MSDQSPAIVQDAREFFNNQSPSAAYRLMRPTLTNNMHRNLATNALLRKYEWEKIDERVQDIARTKLVAVNDLIDYGLVHELDGLGSIYSTYEQLGDMSAAEINMSGATEGERDRVTFSSVTVPIPIISKSFEINTRFLEASRSMGDGIDMTQISVATRRVRDALDALVMNGTNAPVVGGNTIYGYTNHPNRNTGSATGDWGTVANIYPTIVNMIAAAEADNYYGPYGLYVAGTQMSQLRGRYTDGSGDTALSSIMDRLPELEFVHRADSLTDGNLVLVALDEDVVDIAIAQTPTTLQWEQLGPFVTRFKVFAAMAPRVKADSGSRSGIVHYTGA